MTMLDTEDTPLPKDRSDHNTYTLGRIGEHNVIMACLPAGKLGTSSAATVALQMRITFPSIRFGLLVGIGGGVPSLSNDIRLGDVVVSKPGSKGGGVIQYDYGRTVGKGEFMRTGSLNAPPEVLLSALSNLQANHLLNKSNISRHILAASAAHPEFSYVGADLDQLFESDYTHQGGETCTNCDKERMVKRLPRETTAPRVHYGIIASANSVMVDAASRDKLGKEIKALCFEMEAAGLMNSFPCVVIRGISDYSDSHKKKGWKYYAALTAAAYAKELLNIIPPDQVAKTSPIPSPIEPSGSGSSSSSTSSRSRRSLSLRTRSITSESIKSEPSSSHSNSYPQSLFSRYLLFPPNSVALGRLVLDRVSPEQDFCSIPVELTANDVDITNRPRLRETIESARGSRLFHRLTNLFPTFKPNEEFPDVDETTYTLLNSGEVFNRLCNNDKIRKWLQQTIALKRSVYLVVGIHTVHESSLYKSGSVSPAETALEEVNAEPPLGSPGAGELVFGVQYRKVQFKFSSQVDNAHLKMGCNRWKVVSLGERGGLSKGDIIEVSLMESFTGADFQGQEVDVVNDQLIVI